MAEVGTVTIAYAQGNSATKRITFTWEADASGNASGFLTNVLSGTIVRVTTNPAADAPSDDYDVVLLDEDGLDVLAGRGANRDTSNSEHFCPALSFSDGTTTGIAPIVVEGKLELQVSNAGNANDGSLVLYLR